MKNHCQQQKAIQQRCKQRRTLLKKVSTEQGRKKENVLHQSGSLHIDLPEQICVPNIPIPEQKHLLNLPIPSNCSFIIFDLETNGFGRTAEICQIAAKYKDKIFSLYTVPSRGIPGIVTQYTGLSCTDGELFFRGEKVVTVELQVALKAFINFIKEQAPVVLVAHNANSFDAPIIIRAMLNAGLLDKFCAVVSGFCDTYILLKKLLPKMHKHKQTFIAKELLGVESTGHAHEASADVDTLEAILNKIGISEGTLLNTSVSVSHVVQKELRNARVADNKKTLDVMKNVLSDSMLRKIAEAEVRFEHLLDTYKTAGEDGVILLLGSNVGGKVRVTKNKKVLKEVTNYLKHL